MKKRIGILSAGGDCPGINAAIRGVGKTAMHEYGLEVYGITAGYLGLINKDYTLLKEEDMSGLLTAGGTILGTSREKPFKKNGNRFNSIDKPKLIKKHYEEMGLDALVCIGGNGTQKTASQLSELGLNIVGIPKTIDNDVWGTDHSFGFDSAVNIATEAIDRLHSTANSHKRIMVIELMGHHAGWIALYSGLAGGGDVILIPEIGYDKDIISEYLLKRFESKKAYTIVVIAEGIDKPKKVSAASHVAEMIRKTTGLETRETILGYIQRGGSPSPMDRILATRFGSAAVELIVNEHYGNMVCYKDGNLDHIPLKEVGGNLNIVPADHPLIKKGKKLGICFGDKIPKSF